MNENKDDIFENNESEKGKENNDFSNSNVDGKSNNNNENGSNRSYNGKFFFESRNETADKELGKDILENNSTKKEQIGKRLKKKNKSAISKVLAVTLAIIILMFTFFLGYNTALYSDTDYAVAKWVADQINNHAYFATKHVTANDIMRYGIDGVMTDPYSAIMSPQETDQMQNEYAGKAYSIGMTVTMISGIEGVIVIDVTKGSFAEKAGVKPYYRILEVEGEDCRNFNMDQMTAKIQSIPDRADFEIKFFVPTYFNGNPDYSSGKEVTLTLRRDEYETRVVTYYDNQSEEFVGVLDDKTAYIDLDSFIGATEKQFDEAMAKFKTNGKTNLILDLRNNTGGSDYNLQGVAKHLLKDGDEKEVLILTEKYKDGSERKLKTKTCKYDDYNFEKIIVLVNDYSASASEALLIAMKDYGTVDLIIGNTTYGKGTGLTTMVMPWTNYSVRFTVSYFFSPYGNTNEQIGITPTPGYMLDLIEKVPYKHATDNQLMRAVNSLK